LADSEAAAATLQAVKHVVHDFYQYQGASVPFEIFQNADDATVELAHVAIDARNRARFALMWDGQTLKIAHAGRPINEVRVDGTRNDALVARGFDRDLEKMLMIGASDKGTAGHGDVTGKFGMGFKSVFLLSDVPRVLSGRLAFEVVGGVYPRLVNEDAHAALKATIDASRMPAGTVVELPIDERLRPEADTVVRRFIDFAPLVLSFARAIRHMAIEAPGFTQTLEWRPLPIASKERIQAGPIPGGGGARWAAFPAHLLVLDATTDGGRGQLLFGVGPMGVERLPADVPGLWVTVPTEEAKGNGFLVNGAFNLDVGRQQLARDARSNVSLAHALGAGLTESLVELASAIQDDWPAFRQHLGLAPDLGQYQFWESFLGVVAGPFRGRGSGDAVNNLLREMLWADTSRGVSGHAWEAAVVPSNLWAGYRKLVSAREVLYLIDGLLAEEDIFLALAGLDSFRDKVQPGAVVNANNALREVFEWPETARPRTVRLDDVLAWQLQTSPIAPPDLAARVGSQVTAAALDQLQTGTSAQKIEWEAVRKELARFRFIAADGKDRGARELLAHGGNEDESRRAAFAPSSRVLDAAYDADGVAFMRLCRGPLGAGATLLAEWGAGARTPQQRQAFIEYLRDGDLRAEVQERLRRGALPDWLASDAGREVLKEVAGNDAELLYLQSSVGLARPAQEPPGASTPPVSGVGGHPTFDHPGARTVLERIHEWWDEEPAEQIRAYEKRVYAGGKRLKLDHDVLRARADPSARGAWLELFMLGAFHTMGRQNHEQHRGFIDLCKQQQWMDVFALPREEFDAERWMGIVRDHLSGQIIGAPFRYWFRTFVPVFQLSYWLDDYIEIFATADRDLPHQPIEEFLAPRSSPIYQGGQLPPPLVQTLGIGANFVLRELARGGHIQHRHAIRHCFVPRRATRNLLAALGCDDLDRPLPGASAVIAEFLREHLGGDRATFAGAFDIPLEIVATDSDLRGRLFGSTKSAEFQDWADEDWSED
jgi:hypothetical protein